LEVSHLLEQIESLRRAVRFLRTENGYLKGQEMLKEIQSLPSLRSTIGSDGYSYGYSEGAQGQGYDAPRTPSLTADSGSSDIDEDDGETSPRASVSRAAKWTQANKGRDDDKGAVSKGGPRDRDKQGKLGKGTKPSNHANTLIDGITQSNYSTRSSAKPSLQALTTESKILYRELLEYSVSPKLVDLAALEEERKRGWMPQKKTTAYLLWERKRVGERLKQHVDGLRLQTAKLVNSGGS
jgi:dynactin 1